MFDKRTLRTAAFLAIFLIGSIMISNFLLTGCATTTGGQQESKLSAAEKARQDSIARAEWDKQLNLNWSLGYENHKNKMYRDAIPYFWKVNELDTVKRFPDLYTFLGDCYIKLGKPDSAMIVYRMGTEKYPQKTHYHRSLAYFLAAQQQNEEAIEEYKKTIELDPDNPDDYKALGTLLIAEDRIDEALEVYKKLIELEPNNAEVQNIYAQLLATTGDQEAVIEAQEKALKADPKNIDLMFRLGKTYFERSEFEKSIEKFQQLLAIKPDDVTALEYIGNAQQNLGKFREAIATYEKVIALKPDHKKVLCEMATCYRELRQLVKARSIVRKALNIDRNYGLAYIVLGEIYETAVDVCMEKRADKKITFDDKLIYQLAYDQYVKASKDIQFADLARRKMNYLQPDIPTKEDRFMHKEQTKARLDCYQWIYR